MEKQYKNMGGRPRKDEKRSEQLAVMCTKKERLEIELKAKEALCSISEFLRNVGLNANIQIKHIPPELLKTTATMNHIAANLNQIAKKRNMNDELNAIERASLKDLCDELHEITDSLKQQFL